MVKTPTPVDIVISQSEIEDLRKAFLSDYSSKNSDSEYTGPLKNSFFLLMISKIV